MTKELIENQIALLKTTLTGVFEEDYNTAQKINELKKWLRERGSKKSLMSNALT
jgi:hypothetical protein